MWMPGDAARNAKLTRQIIGQNIDRHAVGRQLMPAAREAAIEHAVTISRGNEGIYNWGQLADFGVKHVTDGIIKNRV